MKRTYHSIALAFLLSYASAEAQRVDRLQDLRFYADIMANAELPDSRIRGEAMFNDLLRSHLQELDAWASYDSIPWLQSVTASDSSFRILTWQLERAEGEFTYSGVVQRKDGPLIDLEDRRRLNSEFSNYDQNTWYGALYYGIQDFILTDGSQAWVVLGYNANDKITNIKVADILTFDENGNGLSLGQPVFVSTGDNGTELKHRIIMQYADAAAGRMQFDRERGQLVYDHVVLVNAGPEGAIWVPDGSFHAYQYKDGTWDFVDKVFSETVETPPGEGLKTDGERDILGRKKND